MPVIKAANTPAGLAPFSMNDIEEAARKILLRARGRAEALLAEAQEQAEALKAEARTQGLVEGRAEALRLGLEEGRAAGHKQALAEHRQQLTDLAKALTGAAEALDASRRDLEAHALREVVGLAVAVARRVTKRQAAIDPGVLTANLGAAMRLVVHATDVKIAIHPGQRQALEAVLPALKLQWPRLEHVALIDDASLAPGGCRLITPHGQVGADLDEQLDRVVAELLPAPGGS